MTAAAIEPSEPGGSPPGFPGRRYYKIFYAKGGFYMKMEEPEMKLIRCSDPEQNPAAARLKKEWLDSASPLEDSGIKKGTPASERRLEFPGFCLPLRQWKEKNI